MNGSGGGGGGASSESSNFLTNGFDSYNPPSSEANNPAATQTGAVGGVANLFTERNS